MMKHNKQFIIFFLLFFTLIIGIVLLNGTEAATLTFGSTTEGTSIGDMGQYGPYGSTFVCPYNGTAVSITGRTTRVGGGSNPWSVAGAYYINSTKAIVAQTQNGTVPAGTYNWITCSFTGSQKLIKNTIYLIAFDTNASLSTLFINYTNSVGWGARDTTAYTISFPTPWVSTASYVRKFSVYLTYTNAAPTFSSPSPSNGSTGSALTPKCAITANDLDVDAMTIRFYENSTGSWILRQTNSRVKNGMYRWTFSQATAYETTYYWKVSANDTINNATAIYHFKTRSESAPVFSGVTPTNGSTGVSKSLSQWSLTINDPNGDLFNWTIQSSPNIGSSNANGASNGSKILSLSALAYNTVYRIYTNATDGILWTRAWYQFTTLADTAPALSNPDPGNGTSGVLLAPHCTITVNDANGDPMTVKFYENSTGSWILRQTNSSASNGTYRWTFTQASAYATTYYWKVVSDDGDLTTTEIYHFRTKVVNAPTISPPDPSNGSIDLALHPLLSITINDQNGDLLALNWYTNQTGTWIHRQINASCINGTYRYNFTGATNYSTIYYWRVTCYDGIYNVSAVYHFTTETAPIPPILHNYTSVVTLQGPGVVSGLPILFMIPFSLIVSLTRKNKGGKEKND